MFSTSFGSLGITKRNLVAARVTSSEFDPGSIAGLILHLDSALGITPNGSDVAQWGDLTAEGNDLIQNVASQQPVYNSSDADFNNLPSVGFNGQDEFMSTLAFASGSLSQPTTIFMAIKNDSPTPVGNVFAGITGGKQSYFYSSSKHVMWSGISLVGATVDQSLHIIGMQFDGTSGKGFLDGDTATWAGNSGTLVLDGLTLGARWDQVNFTSIRVAKVLIYDSKLINSDMNLVGNALATKYGSSWTDL